jgi:hypothetical protein
MYDINSQGVRGEDLFLYIYSGGTTAETPTVIAFGTSVELQAEQDTLSSSSKMSCRWNSNLAGKASYTINSDSLYTTADGLYSFDAMMAAMIDGDALPWAIGQAQDETGSTCEERTFALDTTKPYYTGKGIITSLSLNAGTDEVASCSLTLTGSGEITQHGV